MFKNLFAAIGLFATVLFTAGALDIGYFYWYYGSEKITCSKDVVNNSKPPLK